MLFAVPAKTVDTRCTATSLYDVTTRVATIEINISDIQAVGQTYQDAYFSLWWSY